MTDGLSISYKRSPEGSYMILDGESFEPGYEERMLRENEVRALLAFYTVEMDRRIQIWYSITGKRSLRDIVEHDGISLENMDLILRSMSAAFLTIRNYLISQEHLYMSPDTVYFEKDRDKFGAFFCYCPFDHPSSQDQICSIMEFFVSNVDHSKEDITHLCYELYEISAGHGDFDELIKLSEKYNNKSDIRHSIFSDDEADHNSYINPPLNTSDQNTNNLYKNSEVFSDEFQSHSIFQDNESSANSVFIEDNTYNAKKKFSLNLPAIPTPANLFSHFIEWIKSHFFVFRRDKHSPKKLIDPIDDNMIIFDPETSLHEPTVIMREDDREFIGTLLYEGKGDEKDYLINKTDFRIGSRDVDNDADLHSPLVSRHHARIIIENSLYYLEDLNSTNGTYLNGKLLEYHEKAQLQRSDHIAFADVKYLFS